MKPFLANTDWNWFAFLRSRTEQGSALPEANFWQPKATRPMARLAPGTPLFFRLKRPRNCVAGYGFHSHFLLLDLQLAWDWFREANGDPDIESFLQRIGGYRREDLLHDRRARRAPIGCTVLMDCVFWPESRWIPWGEAEGWARNIVQGKQEADEARASRLLAEIQYDRVTTPPALSAEDFHPLEADEREIVLARRRARHAQGAFRSRMLETYGRRCAITGEHTEIVLDAAHIQPYLGPASNHVQNGLLLTKEFHTLFDAGYVTVTPDYRVRVSERLADDWDNGRRYYPVDGEPLSVLPDEPSRPSREALEWHGHRIFLG